MKRDGRTLKGAKLPSNQTVIKCNSIGMVKRIGLLITLRKSAQNFKIRNIDFNKRMILIKRSNFYIQTENDIDNLMISLRQSHQVNFDHERK